MVSWATASKTRLGKEGYGAAELGYDGDDRLTEEEEGKGEGDRGKEEVGKGNLVSDEVTCAQKRKEKIKINVQR